jgi:hypothetical protein
MSQKKSSRFDSSLKSSFESFNKKETQILKNQKKNREIFQ